MSDLKDDLDDGFEKFSQEMMGEQKFKNMAEISKVGNNVQAAAEAQGLMAATRQEFDEMLELAAAKELGAKGAIRDVGKIIKAHEKRLNQAIARGGDDVSEGIHAAMDIAKRDIGKFRDKLSRVKLQDYGHQQTMKRFEDVYERFRVHLETEPLYGAVAQTQKGINALWSKIIGGNPLERGFRKEVSGADWKRIFRTDRDFVSKYVDRLGKPGNEVYERHLAESLQGKMEFVKKMRDSFELTPALRKTATEVESKTASLLKKMDGARNTIGLQNQLDDVIQKSNRLGSIMPMGAGAGVGYMVGGEEGCSRWTGSCLSSLTRGRVIS